MAGLTYFTKNAIECPVCGYRIFREEMRTGRGRQIAGRLTRELRREYEPSKQYGEVFPLIYPITVCPSCLAAAEAGDFAAMTPEIADILSDETDERAQYVESIFPSLDFAAPRTLREGVAAYILATVCYEHFPRDVSPFFKQGRAQLRGAWLASDLHRQEPSENWDYLAAALHRKARYFYRRAMLGEQDGTQPLSGAGYLGPDTDKDYGFDGVLYIAALLELDWGPRDDAAARIANLTDAKKTVARIFGMGRASRNKPAAILNNARDVYDVIQRELGVLGGPTDDVTEEDLA